MPQLSHMKPFRFGSQRKSLRQDDITVKKSLVPLSLALSLIFLVGFADGLVQVTNKKIEDEFQIPKRKVAAFNAASVAAFVIAPLTYAGWCVRKLGYRVSFIIAIFFQGIGTLLFWPCCRYRSFAGMCCANFVVGSSGALLESAMIAYIAGCGPLKWQDMRFNVSGGLSAIADILGAVVAGYTIYGDSLAQSSSKSGLKTMQHTYLATACFFLLLAFVYILIPIPEIEDEEIPIEAQDGRSIGPSTKPFRKQYLLFAAVAASFIWIGGQGSFGAFFMQYAMAASPKLTNRQAAHRLAIYKSLLGVGRLLTALATRWIKGRYILIVSSSVSLILLACAAGIKGPPGLHILGAEYFTKASIGPLLSSLALTGLGRHRKKGASLVVTATSSMAAFAPAFGAIADRWGLRLAVALPAVCTGVVSLFSVFVHLAFGAKLDADSRASENAESAHAEKDSKETMAENAPQSSDERHCRPNS